MRLRARCNLSGCQRRKTLPNTPRNVVRLREREIACKCCGKGKLHQLKDNRQTELDKRVRCRCDGVDFSFGESPHDINTPGCKHKFVEPYEQ